MFFKRFGATSPGVWVIKYLVSPLQRWMYCLTGGAGFAKQGVDHGVLLLTTRGQRTGKERTTQSSSCATTMPS